MRQKRRINGDDERQGMTMIIIRKTGTALLTILKGILQGILFLVKAVLTAAKMVLLLFSLVLRVFLALLGVSVRDQ